MLEIRTLGGLSIKENGAPVDSLRTRKAEAILVFLAVEGGEHRRDAIATLFWPDKSEEHARTSLRVALTDLRKHLSQYLLIDRQQMTIRPDCEVYVDGKDLISKLSNEQYEEAQDLYRVDFLQGFHLRSGSDFDQYSQ